MRHAIALLLATSACATGETLGPPPIDATGDATTLEASVDSTAPTLDVALDSTAPPRDVPVADVKPGVDVAPSGPLRIAQRDVAITPRGSVRQPSVTHHGGADAFVAAYTWVLPASPTPRFRIEARAITLTADATPAPSAALTVDGDDVAHDSGDPAIAAPARGDAPALVVWVDDRATPGARGAIELYGRFVRPAAAPSPSLSAAGERFDIAQRPGSDEHFPAVAWDGAAEGYVVAWADDRERGVRHEDARVVYARAVSATGAVGPEVRVGDESLFQTFPSLASCDEGRVLATWSDYRRDGASYVIQMKGRLLDARTAAPVGPIVQWSEARDVPQDGVAVACAPAGDGWTVAWMGPGPPSVRQLRFARLSRDGALRDGPFGPAMQPDGSRAATLSRVAPAGQTVMTFLAQDSYFGYASALAPTAETFATATTLTPAPPRIGTFWAASAGSARRAEALVVMTLDYDRLHATSLRAM